MKKTIEFRSKLFIKGCNNLIGPNDKVLDVGSGNGVMAWEFKKKIGCDIICTDILNYIQVKLPFIKMNDPCKLPFQDNEFDLVMLIDMLHHTDDSTQKMLITESKRIGKSILIFETRPTLKAMILDHILNFIHEKNMNIPLNFKNEFYWKKILDGVGFKNINYLEIKEPLYYPLSHFGYFCKK